MTTIMDKKPSAGAGSLRERERRAILETLNDTSWNISEAARRLEIGRSTLHRKIKRYGLRRGQSLAEMNAATPAFAEHAEAHQAEDFSDQM
jgi:DNA-binding NtrC family response regulator